ncbi:acetyl-CoA synthetase [Dongia mobilis]|uniref:acetate--CoA ligase n=1 Tax=Dongia mobilis TaxID=578943 RepID=A0A4R6WWM3_9PROT|nr:acetate--CoA ligase [Dongia mobilis]TDQ84444.1 acetyl-CoA synthetase [Dongia mobilis]
MPFATIRKLPAAGERQPGLPEYETSRRGFRWEQARRELSFLPGGALNIAHEAVVRHARGGRGGQLALRWLGKDGACRDFSYRDLDEATGRFANLLRRLGIGRGEAVFSLLGRQPALYIAALGALRAGCVFSPLFAAFGPEPVLARVSRGHGRVLVTTEALYRKKVAPIMDRLPELRHILLVGGVAGNEGEESRLIDHDAALAREDAHFETAATQPQEPALLHFTSGTTGRPKGAIHVHEAVVAHHITGRYALDLRAGDVFWCTADPGWVTGTSYGIIAPLSIGATLIVDEAEYEPERWFDILTRERVNVWYTAPTAIRMMMKLGAKPAGGRTFPDLRFMASVGEPLNPEAVVWGLGAFGLPFHDNWWQTETGGIMIANYASMDIKPGSMGRPLPGIEAAIVTRSGDGHVAELNAPDTIGELALRAGWPSMFRGYLEEDERYRKCFDDGWYLTGDLATRDADGYFWFVGRSDDVIKSAGHLIGPFEVESALMEHDAVAEAAVIGLPDAIAGEIVKAYVVLKAGRLEDDALRKDILAHARRRLGPAVAPREVMFRRDLPRTRSGKIMRRLLKARELGLPEGDLSTLEGGAT